MDFASISSKIEFDEFVGSIRRDFPWAPAGGEDFRPGPAGSGGGPAAPGRPWPGRPGPHKNTRPFNLFNVGPDQKMVTERS